MPVGPLYLWNTKNSNYRLGLELHAKFCRPNFDEKLEKVASGNANFEQPKIFSSFSDTVRSGQSGASKSFNVPLAHPERGREKRDANVGQYRFFSCP